MLKVQVVDFNIQWEGRISEHKKKWKHTLFPPHSNNTPFLFFLDTAAHTLSDTHTSVDVDSTASDHFQKPPQNAGEDSHASFQTENLLDSNVYEHSLTDSTGVESNGTKPSCLGTSLNLTKNEVHY